MFGTTTWPIEIPPAHAAPPAPDAVLRLRAPRPAGGHRGSSLRVPSLTAGTGAAYAVRTRRGGARNHHLVRSRVGVPHRVRVGR